MDAERFDRLVRALAPTTVQRRGVAGFLFGLFGAIRPSPDAAIARRNTKDDKHRKPNRDARKKSRADDIQGEEKKKKKLKICYEGRTIRVSKKARKKYLRRGAARGACLETVLPIAFIPVSSARRSEIIDAALSYGPYKAISDYLWLEDQMLPIGVIEAYDLQVQDSIARAIFSNTYTNDVGAHAMLFYGEEASGEKWSYAIVFHDDEEFSFVVVEAGAARRVEADAIARSIERVRSGRIGSASPRVNICDWLGTLCTDIMDPCFQCKAVCKLAWNTAVTRPITVRCATSAAAICGPFAPACAFAAGYICLQMSSYLSNEVCGGGCDALGYCTKPCNAFGQTCSSTNDCCGGLLCNRGVCGGDTCTAVRASCSRSSECCDSLSCEDNLCDGIVCCGQNGQACSGSCGCCGSLNCVNGSCGDDTCKPLGQSCSNSGECCNNINSSDSLGSVCGNPTSLGDTYCGSGLICCRREEMPCQNHCDCCYSPTLGQQMVCLDGMCKPIGAESDRNLKENFAPVSSRSVLERVVSLPIETWNYRRDDPGLRHIGPMAQDFATAFGVGEDDRHIHPIDGQGVALAAIQGLYEELLTLREANAQLETRLRKLEGSNICTIDN